MNETFILPRVTMEKKELAIRRIEDAQSPLRGMTGLLAPAAWIRSWPMQGNLKIAAHVAKLSPRIARVQLKVIEKTTGVWEKIAREGHDRDLFNTSKEYIKNARDLLKDSSKIIEVITSRFEG